MELKLAHVDEKRRLDFSFFLRFNAESSPAALSGLLSPFLSTDLSHDDGVRL